MAKRILLVEPSYYTRYPPLGLLKLAGYHRNLGDRVRLARGTGDGFNADLIYVTSLFSYAWKPVHESVAECKRLHPGVKVILGGIYASLMPDHAASSGADEVVKGIHEEAESCMPAWDLVPEWDGSILFSSRGCPRRCGFCSVPRLEGKLRIVHDRIEPMVYPAHSRIILWDNNILGSQHWRSIIDELQQIDKKVDFNQGLDARLVTDEVAQRLAGLKIDVIRLAYDDSRNRNCLQKAIERISSAGFRKRDIIVYCLYNYTDSADDFFERVRDLISWGVTSYPMRFEPHRSLVKNRYVSPRWTREELESVAKARRVLGYSGAFPPYAGLVEKFEKAQSFEEAFSLRAIGGPRGKRSTLHLATARKKFGGERNWLLSVSRNKSMAEQSSD
jgi:hypothetical protein